MTTHIPFFCRTSLFQLLLTGLTFVLTGPLLPAQTLGPLRVHPENPRYFADGSGDAIWVWKTFMRGLNPIFMDTYDGKVLGRVRPQDDGPRRAMGQALALSRRINLARSIPQAELSSTGYCLAEPGVSYIVFAPEGGDIEVDLTAAPATFQIEWHNVASGEITKADAVAGGAERLLHPPFSGATVLLLHRPTQP
jgi:hypothetical protein